MNKGKSMYEIKQALGKKEIPLKQTLKNHNKKSEQPSNTK